MGCSRDTGISTEGLLPSQRSEAVGSQAGHAACRAPSGASRPTVLSVSATFVDGSASALKPEGRALQALGVLNAPSAPRKGELIITEAVFIVGIKMGRNSRGADSHTSRRTGLEALGRTPEVWSRPGE